MDAPGALTPHQILAAARIIAHERAPYFQAGLLQLVPREAPGLGTFATTKNWILLWDPEVAAKWGVEGVAAVLVHELCHLVRDHWGRFSAPLINQDLANIAGDLSINPGIQQMGFKLPTEGCFPQKFGLPDDLTAEQYYEKLLKMDVRYVYVDACGEAGEEGHKFPDKTVIVEGCGSCSGRKRRGEPEDGDADDRSEREIARTRVTIAKAIRNHKGRGTIPGDLVRWSDEALRPPKIRWQDKLARACRGAVAYRPGSGYSTYAKLSRRQAGIGFGSGKPTLPSYRATLPRVTFLVDTSGSMDNDALIRAMSEAQGILTTCGAQLDVVVCDAEVHGAKSVRSIKEACALLKGGGGSDFRPAFDQILRARPKPSIIVAATDGDIAVPVNEPPGVRVIWLLVAKGYDGRSRTPCDWGTVIEIDS